MPTVDSKTAVEALEYFEKELMKEWKKGWKEGYSIGYRKGLKEGYSIGYAHAREKAEEGRSKKVTIQKGRKTEAIFFMDKNKKEEKEKILEEAPIDGGLPPKPKSNKSVWEWLLEKYVEKKPRTAH